jgi:hypothetical protein
MNIGQHFTSAQRDNGDRFVKTKDDCPEWLKDAIQEAHQGDLPNDWIYSVCDAACCAIDDDELTDEDSLHEWADGQVDIYTKDLATWYADMCNSSTFSNAEGEAEDAGCESSDIDERLKVIQYYAISSIGRTILDAVKSNESNDDD